MAVDLAAVGLELAFDLVAVAVLDRADALATVADLDEAALIGPSEVLIRLA